MPYKTTQNKLRDLYTASLDATLGYNQAAGEHVAIEADWLADLPNRYCWRCGVTTGLGSVTKRGCARCIDTKLHWDSLTRLAAYTHPVEPWILQMKFHKAWHWATWFADQLAQVIPPQHGRNVVVPVPLHRLRRWRRGYDQAALIAKRLAAARDWPYAPILRRTRPTQPQSRLHTQQQRCDNIRNAFACRPRDLAGWNVWLIDDVKTTGNTLGQCARLLRQHGANNTHVAVIAVADPLVITPPD